MTASVSLQVNVNMKSTAHASSASGPDAAATLTIGELAGRFGLATHVLRHWEAMGLITPDARVNGRRRFSTDQLARVAMIVRGKGAGMSLDQLRDVLSAPSPAARRGMLERHHRELERRIAEVEASKRLIEHALSCSSEDFTRCPGFQHLVRSLSGGPTEE